METPDPSTPEPDEFEALSPDEVLKELRNVLRRASLDARKAAASANRAAQAESDLQSLLDSSKTRTDELQRRVEQCITDLQTTAATTITDHQAKVTHAITDAEIRTKACISDAEVKISAAILDTQTKATNTVAIAETQMSAAVSTAQQNAERAELKTSEATRNAATIQDLLNESATTVRNLEAEFEKYFTNENAPTHFPTLYDNQVSGLIKIETAFWGADRKSGISGSAKETVEQLKEAVGKATDLIETLTDVSIHGAFNKRERTIDQRHTSYQILLIFCVAILVAVGYSFVSATPTLTDILLHSSLLLPLSYLLWVVNRTIKVEKRLAESYRHKASTMDALIGYRNLYKLKHTDEEYLKIFDRLQAEIIDDPGKHIEKLLTSRLEDGSSTGLFGNLFGVKKLADSASSKEGQST